MKTKILSSTIALLLAAVPLARAEEPKVESNSSSSSGASVKTEADGSVTVEIDVNGKKESKTFKLGDKKPFVWNLDGDKAARVQGLLKAGKQALGKLEKITWLGVAAEPASDEVRAQLPLQPGEGLAVRHVMPESPAAKAGLQEHDILLRLDDQILVSGDQLRSLVKMRKSGETVKLSYLRKGEKAEVTATLAEHEVDPGEMIRMLKGRDFDAIRGEIEEGRKELEGRLREMKEKVPGMILEKKSFLIGPDGQLKKIYGEKLNDVLEDVRKQLEKVEISPEDREKIQKSVEEALRHAREAIEKTEDVVKQKGDLLKLRDEVRKTTREFLKKDDKKDDLTAPVDEAKPKDDAAAPKLEKN